MSNNDKLSEDVRKLFPGRNIISASWDGDGRIVIDERMFFVVQPDKFYFSPIVGYRGKNE